VINSNGRGKKVTTHKYIKSGLGHGFQPIDSTNKKQIQRLGHGFQPIDSTNKKQIQPKVQKL
jgi:hypothetical protein